MDHPFPRAKSTVRTEASRSRKLCPIDVHRYMLKAGHHVSGAMAEGRGPLPPASRGPREPARLAGHAGESTGAAVAGPAAPVVTGGGGAAPHGRSALSGALTLGALPIDHLSVPPR